MTQNLSKYPPTAADNVAIRAVTNARSALRETLQAIDVDGDFRFACEHRLELIEQSLAAMELLFIDLHGSVCWAETVSQPTDGPRR